MIFQTAIFLSLSIKFNSKSNRYFKRTTFECVRVCMYVCACVCERVWMFWKSIFIVDLCHKTPANIQLFIFCLFAFFNLFFYFRFFFFFFFWCIFVCLLHIAFLFWADSYSHFLSFAAFWQLSIHVRRVGGFYCCRCCHCCGHFIVENEARLAKAYYCVLWDYMASLFLWVLFSSWSPSFSSHRISFLYATFFFFFYLFIHSFSAFVQIAQFLFFFGQNK